VNGSADTLYVVDEFVGKTLITGLKVDGQGFLQPSIPSTSETNTLLDACVPSVKYIFDVPSIVIDC
jgi:hypothetical protein